jgi:hypothetical protein
MKNKSNVPLVRLFGIIAFVAVIGFSMTVFGCDDGSKDDNGGNGGNGGTVSIPETNVQVYNTNGTEYTGSGKVRLNLAEGGSVEIGTVTDGKLTLSLPSNADTLAAIGSTQINVVMDGLVLIPTGSYSGRYFSYKGQTGDKSYSVHYKYSKTDYNLDYTSGNYVYQINIKAGWVKILTINEAGKYLITSNLSGLPSDMKWTVE